MIKIPKLAMNVIVDIITLAPSLFASARHLYGVVRDLVDEAEEAYDAGETKKDAVMNALRTICDDKGVEWEDLRDALSDLIEIIVTIKNKAD